MLPMACLHVCTVGKVDHCEPFLLDEHRSGAKDDRAPGLEVIARDLRVDLREHLHVLRVGDVEHCHTAPSDDERRLRTVVSMATPAAPLSPSTGTTLSAQYKTHDSK